MPTVQAVPTTSSANATGEVGAKVFESAEEQAEISRGQEEGLEPGTGHQAVPEQAALALGRTGTLPGMHGQWADERPG